LTITLDQAASAESIRFLLRRETRAEHAVLDQHPGFVALVDGRLDLDGYRALMQAMHGLYLRIDGSIAEACAAHGLDRHGFAYEPRTSILGRDLAGLGVADATPSDAAVPALPLGTSWSLAGALYVIEGSVLGGSMLCMATTKILDGKTVGSGYWQWCRREGAARWAMTCQLLDDLATSTQARDGMVTGARAAFDLFAQHLDPLRMRPARTVPPC
jgi:heme oxygenase